jgi:proteic killer suppression protein
MIKRFRHKGIEAFFKTGSRAGINPTHASKLRRQLGQLNESSVAEHMRVHGWSLHPLTGDLAGHYSVWVNGNWRMTFTFEGEDAVLVDYQDYH